MSSTWEQSLESRVSDVVALRADVWRSRPGRYPTLLIREPYGKRNAENVTYSHPKERLIPPGDVVKFTLRSSCSHLYRAGHRIRLHVTSSSFPMGDRNLNTGGRFAHEVLADRRTAVNTVFHDDRYPSQLTLPSLG